MDLRTLERVWHGLGRRDPYWAALTHADKKGGGWSEDEFFRTGEQEISAMLDRAGARGWPALGGRALDFGCGAGRLTQALAARFDQVDGVDISRSMLAEAHRHNRYPERCRYHHNTAPNLGAFEDGAFDFVYSTLTLQHVPPEYARRYVSELVRVLAPRQLLVFQLPSHRGPVEPKRTTTHTLAARKLPRSAFLAEVSLEPPSLTMHAGEKRLLGVTLRNTSPDLWPSGGRDDGLYQLQVGNQWRSADGTALCEDDARSPLPHDLPPGGEAHVFLEITAPDTNGDYELVVDLVQEHVAWFHQRGSRSAVVTCSVEGGKPAGLGEPRRGQFRARYPRLHALLVALGADVVRVTLRRRVSRVRTGRWQKAAMVMYCIPRSEVEALLTAAGGRVLEVEQDLLTSGFQTCRYWVTKD